MAQSPDFQDAPQDSEIRTQKLQGVNETLWLWPRKDSGAWDGPVKNWNEDHYEKYFKHVTGHSCVVTAGANMGLHTRCYSAKFELVYAFEPDWTNFYYLSRNCPYPNVFKFHAALGSIKTFAKIHRPSDSNFGMHRINHKDAVNGDKIPVLRIDDLPFTACDLIQLDAEGSEEDIIFGALETIEEYLPVIIVESGVGDILNAIGHLGYEEVERSGPDKILKKVK